MESKISFTNEKDLIYGYKWEGSDLPKYGFCKVYKNGVVDFGKGWLFNNNKYTKGRLSISEEAVAEIQKLIHDNSKILSFKELESDGQFVVTDAETSTFYFSDGQKNNMLSVYALWAWKKSEYLSKYPKLALLVKLHESIRKILVDSGLGEEYC